jgi:ABC-2 type transport system permease protein
VLRFPDWVVRLSPYSHVPTVPAEGPDWVPLLILTLLAVALVTVGTAKAVKRDIG